ncbi:MAG: metalloregulator ArsR/SmtB family transcription factor [Candidatus Eisenbacteria bacterium]
MKIINEHVFHLHAEFCKTMANTKRLMILALLARREMNVGEIAEALETPGSNISQHLRVLRDKNVVLARKNGQMVYYRLADPRIMEGCTLIRSVLLEDLKQRGLVANDLEVEDLVVDA